MSQKASVEAVQKNQPMVKPRVEKVTVNMAVGKAGEPLERAVKVLQQITGQVPSRRKANKTIRDFGIRQGEPMACIVTLRGQIALEFLKKALQAVGNKLSQSRFDQYGNFSFGIREHIEIPGTKYIPELGIFGMNICVTMSRPGQRVSIRRRRTGKIGTSHRLTRGESIQFIKDLFGTEIGED
ncbi:MAG TPA: 50S ribosomal protein L5 [archaeon]|nr:50S ribosomal protein L5 [archaeon]